MNGKLKTLSSGHQGAHRPDAHPRESERADLRLLDRLFLAAELHRGVHLDAEPAAGRGLELLAQAHDCFDGRIAERMHVGGLEHELLLREGADAQIGRERAQRGGGAETEHGAAVHDVLPDAMSWTGDQRRPC
jgi:hypothetical protein